MEACTSKAAISPLHVHERRSTIAQSCFANVLGNENLAEKQIVHLGVKSLWHANLPRGTPIGLARGLYLCKRVLAHQLHRKKYRLVGRAPRVEAPLKPSNWCTHVVHNTNQKSYPSLIMTLLAA